MTGVLHKEIRLVDNLYFAQAAERLSSGTAVRLSVMGNSMLPFIIGGQDQVTLVPYTGQDLPLGIAALYQWEGKYMIHRLVKKDESHYHFLGDGNICRFETIKRNEVLGILQTIHHPNGKETKANICAVKQQMLHPMERENIGIRNKSTGRIGIGICN